MRHAPHLRLHAEDAAEAGRNADRSAAVAGRRQRAHAAGHRGRGAAARPAGVVPHIPGIVRFAKQCIGRQRDQPELRGVRLADDDRAGAFQAFDDRLVMVRDEILEKLRAERRTNAGRQVQILDRDRHAPQRRQLFAAHHGRFGLACLASGEVIAAGDDGRQRPVEPIGLGQRGVDRLDRRKRAARIAPASSWALKKQRSSAMTGVGRGETTRHVRVAWLKNALRRDIFCQRPVGLLSWRRATRVSNQRRERRPRRNFQTPPARPTAALRISRNAARIRERIKP